MSWSSGLVASVVVALGYVLVAAVLLRPPRGWRPVSHAPAAATAAVLLTCAVYRLSQAGALALPGLGVDGPQGEAVRAAWSRPLAWWDLLGAVVALSLWSLHRRSSTAVRATAAPEGAAAPDRPDRPALHVDDHLLQRLVVARMSLERGDHDRALEILDDAIASAGTTVTGRLDGATDDGAPAGSEGRR